MALADESRILPRPIEEEMRTSYLDYAMSVIVSRALPDARDGLKPVQRRILFGMLEAGLRPDRPYRKSAAVVGDVMKKYHPHGDVPIYESLVRMAQPWSVRYPLVDGQGNFGSIDGDPPAAMRYSECSITPLAKAEMEELKGGRTAVIVTEIPYMVNKAALIARIAELVRNKKLAGISDLRDESDRSGMRIVMELRRDANPQIVRNQLYKHTQMQTTFGANMLALVAGVPRTLKLREMLNHYLQHRRTVVIRRTKFELSRAEERAHILEGLKVALKHLDAVIELIKKSKDVPAARGGLMKRFKLSERQADAILEM